jgi:DNA-binding NarL/FixJ family response regulator
VRLVLAEDNPLLRDGLAALLADRGHRVVAAVADADALLAAVAAEAPDVAVVDVRMPPTFSTEGVQAALRLRADRPECAVLVLSQWVETQYARQLLAGPMSGIGYLLKDRLVDTEQFLDALDRVAAGGTVLDPEVVGQLLGADRGRAALDRLSPRERQVLDLVAQGRSNSAIAARLRVTERSVEKHVTAIFTKLDLPAAETDHRRVLAVLRWLDPARG